MRRIENLNPKAGEFETIVEIYNNFSEFCSVQNNRELVWKEHYEPTREVKYDSDKRCDTFEQAQDYLLHGFDENVKEMIASVGALQKTGTKTQTQLYSDVVGFAPIVPNALLGLPNSMMNSKKKQVKTKVVTIVYDPAVQWGVSPQSVLEFGCRMINCIMNLEKNGYRVRVDYLKVHNDSYADRQYMFRIPIKSEHNPVNIKRLAFPMSHIAMQRYLAWDWIERLPKSRAMDGYGHSLSANASAKEKENVKKYLRDDEYLVYYGMDVETVFKQIESN